MDKGGAKSLSLSILHHFAFFPDLSDAQTSTVGDCEGIWEILNGGRAFAGLDVELRKHNGFAEGRIHFRRPF